MSAIELRLARLAWSAVVGLGLVLLYAIFAPRYPMPMSYYEIPPLLRVRELPAVVLAAVVGAAFTYLATRDPRVLRGVAVVASAIAILVIFAIVWPRVVSFVWR